MSAHKTNHHKVSKISLLLNISHSEGSQICQAFHGEKVLEHQPIDSDRQKQLSDIIPTAFHLKRTSPLGYRRYLEENTLTTIRELHAASRQ